MPQRKRGQKSWPRPPASVWWWVGGGILGVVLATWYLKQSPQPAKHRDAARPPTAAGQVWPPENWPTYRVADPQNPQLHYAISIPPDHRAVFREFGYDVEILNPAGEVVMLVARYRGPNGELDISTGQAKVIADQRFGNGRAFVLETPPEAFNPNAPVWWNNAQRQEVHLPVPPLKWVVVFSAPTTVPGETFTTFASSLRLPRPTPPPER